jgi:hypothetical protein
MCGWALQATCGARALQLSCMWPDTACSQRVAAGVELGKTSQSLWLEPGAQDSAYFPMKNTYGAVWEASLLPALPLDLRLTDSAGHTVVARSATQAHAQRLLHACVHYLVCTHACMHALIPHSYRAAGRPCVRHAEECLQQSAQAGWADI